MMMLTGTVDISSSQHASACQINTEPRSPEPRHSGDDNGRPACAIGIQLTAGDAVLWALSRAHRPRGTAYPHAPLASTAMRMEHAITPLFASHLSLSLREPFHSARQGRVRKQDPRARSRRVTFHSVPAPILVRNARARITRSQGCWRYHYRRVLKQTMSGYTLCGEDEKKIGNC
jgi:hypothetical protein